MIDWKRASWPQSVHEVVEKQKRRGIIGRPKYEKLPDFSGMDLKRWRKSRLMTQADLAATLALLGLASTAELPTLSHSTISTWENGGRMPPWLPERLKIIHEHYKQYPLSPIGQACIALDAEQDQADPNTFDPFTGHMDKPPPDYIKNRMKKDDE